MRCEDKANSGLNYWRSQLFKRCIAGHNVEAGSHGETFWASKSLRDGAIAASAIRLHYKGSVCGLAANEKLALVVVLYTNHCSIR